jgi:hypothetical protein
LELVGDTLRGAACAKESLGAPPSAGEEETDLVLPALESNYASPNASWFGHRL